MYLIIASSKREQSNSRLLAEAALQAVQSLGHEVELIHLKEYPLPFCDGESAYSDPNVAILAEKIEQAQGVLLACPIYNYGINSMLKNLIELTSQNWQEKVVGFLCAAGGMNSYMSIMGTASSMMLSFRCLILPKFVYATDESFDGNRINDAEVEQRIAELARSLIRIGTAMRNNP